MHDPSRVGKLFEQVRQIFAHQPPEIVGEALADLVALWLAGYHVDGDENATRAMRAELLVNHCYAVRDLTSINAKIIGTTP